MSSSNCCFLTCIQVSQEVGQGVWYFHLFQNFPQFIVIHTVKGFGIVNKAVIDIFLELSCLVKEKAYRQQERNKIAFVYRWHDHLCKNSKRVSKPLLELINYNRKVAGYKVNQWKLTDFLCTNYEQMELKSMVLFTLAPQNILKFKSNKLRTRSIWGKVQNFDEQINKRNK